MMIHDTYYALFTPGMIVIMLGTYNNVEVRYAYRMTMVKNSFR